MLSTAPAEPQQHLSERRLQMRSDLPEAAPEPSAENFARVDYEWWVLSQRTSSLLFPVFTRSHLSIALQI
jgi:hypothetical protein